MIQDSDMNLSQNADNSASCQNVQDPEFLPRDLCGLDPSFHVFNRMYIKDILNMSEYPNLPGAFAYKNHPIFKVDILGVVVKVDKKFKLDQYGVDDGTGVIMCCIWNDNNYGRPVTDLSKLMSFLPSSLGSKVHQIEQSRQMDFMLGDLVHVRGRVSQFHQLRQITAKFAVCVNDSLSEMDRMVELPRLYKNVYNKPFQIPRQLNNTKMEELGAEATKKKVIEDLTAMLKGHLKESQKKLFEVKQILQDKNLHSAILEISSKDQQSADLENLLENVVEAMEKTGEICRHRDKKNTYESLLSPDSEMSALILKILQKEKDYNSYSEKGCHVLKVESELKKTRQYADVRMASIRFCLDLLEMNSDIISNTDSHYIVC